MEGSETVEKLLSEALGYAEKAQETWVRLRGTTFWVESAEAAQLGPLAQGLCSYAQRFTTTLEAISKSAEEQETRGRNRKRKERGQETERATTPDAAEALTALQGLEELAQEAEEQGDLPSLLAEPRELDSTSDDEKPSTDDPLAGIPLTSYTVDYITGEASSKVMDERMEDGTLGASSDSADIADLKKCNCKKSRCLKLYCECFSSGVFCESACMCQDCLNIVQFTGLVSETRQHILDRSPNAFAPKVSSEGGHKKGCHCKKSRCLKKYCECYQANVPCTEACRCENCENTGPSAPCDESPQESLFENGAAPLASLQNAMSSQAKSSEGRGRGQDLSQGHQTGGSQNGETEQPQGFISLSADAACHARTHGSGLQGGQAPDGSRLRPRPQPSAAAIRARSGREEFKQPMSNLGITARSSSSGFSIGFDSNGGVAYAMHAAPTVSTASGQPMGSLRRSNRQAHKLISQHGGGQSAALPQGRTTAIASRMHIKTENWPPQGKPAVQEAVGSQTLLPLGVVGKVPAIALTSLAALPVQASNTAAASKHSSALVVADASVGNMALDGGEPREQVQNQASALLRDFQCAMPDPREALPVPGISVQTLSGQWRDKRNQHEAHALVVDTTGEWAKLRQGSKASGGAAACHLGGDSMTNSRQRAVPAPLTTGMSDATADDAISPPQPSVSGCTQGISSSAVTAGHTFQALAEKLVSRTKRQRHEAAGTSVEAIQRPRVASWAPTPAAPDAAAGLKWAAGRRRQVRDEIRGATDSEHLVMLADLASDVGLAEGEETAASERGGAAADSSAQAQERTAVKVEGFAGQVGVLTFLSPQMADVSADAQRDGFRMEGVGPLLRLVTELPHLDIAKVSPAPGTEDTQNKKTGKENTSSQQWLATADGTSEQGATVEQEAGEEGLQMNRE